MVNRYMYFIILFIVWLLLTWSLDVQNVAAGIVIVFLCTVFTGQLFFDSTTRMLNPRRIFWFLYYIPVFFIHMVKANLDVAYRVLHLNVPIRPGIVRVKTTMKSELGLTMLANSITLTPGTLTVDIIGDDMYIHWINVRADGDIGRQTAIIVERFETILKRVFE